MSVKTQLHGKEALVSRFQEIKDHVNSSKPWPFVTSDIMVFKQYKWMLTNAQYEDVRHWFGKCANSTGAPPLAILGVDAECVEGAGAAASSSRCTAAVAVKKRQERVVGRGQGGRRRL